MNAPRFYVTLPTRTERAWEGYGPSEHRAQAVQAAEISGFDGVVAPYDLDGEESTVIANDALRHSRWLEVVHELHITSANPVYAAKGAASTQRFTDQRLSWRLAIEAPTYSQSTPAATTRSERFARAEEFLTVARGVWENETFDFSGTYHAVQGGGFRQALAGLAFPRVCLSGTSDEALAFSARHADTHVFGSIDEVRSHAAALRAGSTRELEIALEAPITVREDARELADAPSGTAGLFGTYEQVAQQIGELVDAGVSVFVLDARPRVEETYRIGEHLLPLVQPARHAAPVAVTGGEN